MGGGDLRGSTTEIVFFLFYSILVHMGSQYLHLICDFLRLDHFMPKVGKKSIYYFCLMTISCQFIGSQNSRLFCDLKLIIFSKVKIINICIKIC